MKKLALSLLVVVGSLALAQIPNFIQVDTGIYRGGRPEIADIADLSTRGIRTIINLQGGDLNAVAGMFEPGEDPQAILDEKNEVERLKMNFYNFPLASTEEVSAAEDLEIDRILEVMHDPSAQPVFVHCEHGKDRTGMLIALYHVKFDGWSVDQAHQDWVDNGHGTLNSFFTGDLDDYFYTKAASFTESETLASCEGKLSRTAI